MVELRKYEEFRASWMAVRWGESGSQQCKDQSSLMVACWKDEVGVQGELDGCAVGSPPGSF
jgi:hypothetical protein